MPVAVVIGKDLGVVAAVAVALRPWFSVETAASAAAGLQQILDTAPALIVIDVTLDDGSTALAADWLQSVRSRCLVITTIRGAPTASALASRLAGVVDDISSIELVLAIVRQHFTAERAGGCGQSHLGRYVGDAIRFLGKRYAEDIELKTVADAIGISWSHLAHLFRIETGLSVMTYLRAVRAEVARRELLDSAEPLKMVAERTGFYDAAHLSHIVKQYIGVTPSTLRRVRCGTVDPMVILSGSDRRNFQKVSKRTY